MKLLSHLSPNGDGLLPLPADARLLQLGRTAWDEALAAAADPGAAEQARSWSADGPGKSLLDAILSNSAFLAGIAIAEWAFLSRLVEEGAGPLFDVIIATTESRAEQGENRAALMRRLRIARRRVALLAAVAELAGSWSLEQQMAALSRFAEAAIGAAVRRVLRDAAANGAISLPDPDDPEAGSGFIVLAVGKLGGGELNYSSDIDLILLYELSDGTGVDEDRAQSLFARMARDAARILDERTGDGYVFRTDLRLRPDPRSTPLAISVAAARSPATGRALIKAARSQFWPTVS